MTGLPLAWGAVGDEHTRAWPVDARVPGPVLAMTRAVSVRAPVDLTWRWACQLAVAPYSYDLVDNLARRSPRSLTPGLERLERGQRFASIFTLVDWAPDEMVALEITEPAGIRLFGRLPLIYQTVPLTDGPIESDGPRTTLRGDIALPRARSAPARARSTALAWGDRVMMRRQLQTLGRLSEGTARSTRSS